jgi:hypothetical protein
VKKTMLTILTVIYLALSSGIAMDIHYCMGERAGVNYYESENDTCSKCGMKESKRGCCHNEHRFHKLEDSHKNVYNDINLTAGAFIFTTTYALYDWQLIKNRYSKPGHYNSPPLYKSRQACIMNGVFRI